MNILLINHYAGSPEMGMEFRPYYFAREWIKMGHKVDIIAGNYSHLRRTNPEVYKDFQKEHIDGITYHWVKTGSYVGNGTRRALTMIRFCFKLFEKSKFIVNEVKPDVVISSSTYPLDNYPARWIAKKANARIIHEVHDMWPATLVELGGMSKLHPFIILMQVSENSAYRHSDYVVSLPPLAKEYMVKHGMKSNKFRAITNGIVIQDWMEPESLPKDHQLKLQKIKEDGKFIIGYFGGHALSNALSVLVDAASQINNKNIHFVLVGDGVEKKMLQKTAKERKLQNITFLSTISKKSIPTLTNYLDCIYMGGKASSLYRFGLCMNKIFDSMMAGKPIICSITTPDLIIEQHRCGIMVEAEDVKKLIAAIEKLYHMSKEEREYLGQNGKNAVLKYYNYEVLSQKFAQLF